MAQSTQEVAAFQQQVWQYYNESARSLPWRDTEPDGSFDPYKIMVSELMLQQTQVSRVLPKYSQFLTLFPTIEVLAGATQAEVLRVWSGLGYNRRARYLHQTAQIIVKDHEGKIPTNEIELVKLPGVGHNTAGAILAYAYGQPVAFVETNIRTVFIHHFYADAGKVTDAEIRRLVSATLPDNDDPSTIRHWFWALMDYGSYLKSTGNNNLVRSTQYRKQSPFKGSLRQARGEILRKLHGGPQPVSVLLLGDSELLKQALQDLVNEGLVKLDNGLYEL